MTSDGVTVTSYLFNEGMIYFSNWCFVNDKNIRNGATVLVQFFMQSTCNEYIYIYVCVLVDRLVKTWKNLQWNRESKVGGLHTFKIKIIHCSIFTGREREHS